MTRFAAIDEKWLEMLCYSIAGKPLVPGGGLDASCWWSPASYTKLQRILSLQEATNKIFLKKNGNGDTRKSIEVVVSLVLAAVEALLKEVTMKLGLCVVLPLQQLLLLSTLAGFPSRDEIHRPLVSAQALSTLSAICCAVDDGDIPRRRSIIVLDAPGSWNWQKLLVEDTAQMTNAEEKKTWKSTGAEYLSEDSRDLEKDSGFNRLSRTLDSNRDKQTGERHSLIKILSWGDVQQHLCHPATALDSHRLGEWMDVVTAAALLQLQEGVAHPCSGDIHHEEDSPREEDGERPLLLPTAHLLPWRDHLFSYSCCSPHRYEYLPATMFEARSAEVLATQYVMLNPQVRMEERFQDVKL